MIVENVIETGAMRCRDVEFLNAFLGIAARTIGQSTLHCGVDGIPHHAAVNERLETFDSEEVSMDPKRGPTTGLARFAQIDEAVACWPAQFGFLNMC